MGGEKKILFRTQMWYASSSGLCKTVDVICFISFWKTFPLRSLGFFLLVANINREQCQMCFAELLWNIDLILTSEDRWIWSDLNWSAVRAAAAAFPVRWTFSVEHPPRSVGSIHVICICTWTGALWPAFPAALLFIFRVEEDYIPGSTTISVFDKFTALTVHMWQVYDLQNGNAVQWNGQIPI